MPSLPDRSEDEFLHRKLETEYILRKLIIVRTRKYADQRDIRMQRMISY